MKWEKSIYNISQIIVFERFSEINKKYKHAFLGRIHKGNEQKEFTKVEIEMANKLRKIDEPQKCN